MMQYDDYLVINDTHTAKRGPTVGIVTCAVFDIDVQLRFRMLVSKRILVSGLIIISVNINISASTLDLNICYNIRYDINIIFNINYSTDLALLFHQNLLPGRAVFSQKAFAGTSEQHSTIQDTISLMLITSMPNLE